MKTTSTMTSKGQVTVPIAIRRKLGLKSGDKIEFTDQGKRIVIRRVIKDENPFEKYRGIFKGTFKSVKEINQWVREMRGDDGTP